MPDPLTPGRPRRARLRTPGDRASVAPLVPVAPPTPFPYQGSKRKLAATILACVPDDLGALHEPFCGSAAIGLAVAAVHSESPVHLNDSNQALAELWQAILDRPEEVADGYARLWYQQADRPRDFYDEIRDKFNAIGDPVMFLYLLARCVKAAVRYNAAGEFNQSPDNRRLGAHPDRMRRNIMTATHLLGGHTTTTCLDFREALVGATPSDVVYLDPPYQGVSTNRDRRYAGTVAYDAFVDALAELNARSISYIISYDGRTGSKVHGKQLPRGLGLSHFDIDAGRSTQATLAGRAEHTVESLYLSAPLVERLGGLGVGDVAAST